MTEPTYEDELLGHLATAGMLTARLIATASGQQPGEGPDIRALKAAGYREQTPFDEHLRRELGEQRWAKYAPDPARIVCAALITDGAAAGRDMDALLSTAADMRAWEDDASPRLARSPGYSLTASNENSRNQLPAVPRLTRRPLSSPIQRSERAVVPPPGQLQSPCHRLPGTITSGTSSAISGGGSTQVTSTAGTWLTRSPVHTTTGTTCPP
jgi:hypothetical protein